MADADFSSSFQVFAVSINYDFVYIGTFTASEAMEFEVLKYNSIKNKRFVSSVNNNTESRQCNHLCQVLQK